MRARLLGALVALAGCVEYGDGRAGVRYDLEGLPSCSRLSALASYQGSCEEGEACAWAPELGAGVCAPGCDTHEDCPDGAVCRATDDGAGWARSWCAPVVREEI